MTNVIHAPSIDMTALLDQSFAAIGRKDLVIEPNNVISSDNGAYLDFDYKAILWHEAAFFDQSRILLFTGSAGGGKSRLAAEKVHHALKSYSKSMWLMVRKTRESMNNSTVLFYASTIAGRDKRIVHSKSMHRFEYPNGSILAYGGMKDDEQREQVRSIGQDGGLDGVWMEEANRFTFEDYQELIPRMRGKAGPFRQMILTTNPDYPGHWINKKLIVGKAAQVYYSGALDNPFNPPEYLESLNMLTGVQRERLVEGKWVQAEGTIYDNFDPDINVTESAEYDPSRPVLWGGDDGYARGDGPGTLSYHPRVFLLAQETGDGGINVFAERYSVGESSYDVTFDALLALPYPRPDIAYIDSSAAMMRGALTVRDIANTGATHPVLEGIRNVRRMIKDGNKKVLLRIHPRCEQLISEMQSYRYDDAAQVPGDRKPLKQDDHGPDALRYLCWHLRFGE